MRLTEILPPIPTVRRLLRCSLPAPEAEVDFWMWARSLQGVVNRCQPHLYLIGAGDPSRAGRPSRHYERHWADYYEQRFQVATEATEGVDELLGRYAHLVDGYVRYDAERVLQTQNLAVTRAGLEGLLPIAPSQEHWMTRHGIPKRDDLCGRFADNTQAAAWAIEHLWPHTCRRLFANFCIHRPSWFAQEQTVQDFVVYHRGFALDLPLSRQSRTTQRLYRKMLEGGLPPGMQMGWHCICDQEKEYVAKAAEHAFFTLCSVMTPNLTVHGGVGDPQAAYTQPMPPTHACQAEKDAIYVCFYVSDGDATWAMHNLHSDNWSDPARGAFPLGWGLLPLMTHLMPAMLQYYHETRAPKDCFWGPSSGAAYTYTHKWPDAFIEGYLRETRRLLDQSGQHGCNMVNWFLRDWWREVEDDAAIRREQEALATGPGLVCGLGGSPYAKSYLSGPIPKVHAMHIANVGHDTLADILRFADECPTRPAFLFLFAQIAPGILNSLAIEMDGFGQHPEIQICSMDTFFLTLQDAIRRGLTKGRLYQPTEALAETWLKGPGRHRLPLCERLTEELLRMAQAPPQERRRGLAQARWKDLVSCEIEHVAADRQAFLSGYPALPPIPAEQEADTLLYAAFTVAWTLMRAAIEASGLYANHRNQCLKDFERICGPWVDMAPFHSLFAAWENWENRVPTIEVLTRDCQGIAAAARILCARLGPEKSEDFTGWPPRTI